MRTLLLLVLLAVSAFAHTSAQQLALKTRIVTSDLRVPWELVWGPDNMIWMTELNGGITRVNPTTGEKIVVLASLPDRFQLSESGLLGMVLHPQFADMPFVYIAYTYLESPTIKVKIVRYRYDGATLVEPTILIGDIRGGGVHNGCRLAFGPDGMLYITTGDGGNPDDAQKLNMRNGKVLRIHPDGSIPSDNPFAGSPIWSWGHRNAQGLTFGPNGVLYSSEHGPTTDDEVNIIMKARNYGWPSVEGLCNAPSEIIFCEDSNVVEPIGTPWTPTLAPGAIKYYNSDLIAEWKDHLLMTAMKQQATLVVMELSPDRSRIISEKRYFKGQFGRLRSLCVAPDGRVFMGSSNRDTYGDSTQHPGSDWIIEISPQPSSVEDGTSKPNGSNSNTVQLATFHMRGSQLTAIAHHDNATLIVTDIIGRTVSEHRDGVGGFHVDLSSLPSGVYCAVVHTAEGAQSFTFVR